MKTQLYLKLFVNYQLFLEDICCCQLFPNWFRLFPAASKIRGSKVICPQLYLYHGDRKTIIWVVRYANILYYAFYLYHIFFHSADARRIRMDQSHSKRHELVDCPLFTTAR